jgi:sulfite reductase (ferredoxin)
LNVEALYHLPPVTPEELEQWRHIIGQFCRGEISADQFQAWRVPRGIYEQREPGTFMLRTRLLAGILRPGQMRAAADVAETFGRGMLHLSSRQNLQVHGVAAGNIYPALERLATVGLVANGGGGNTLRNVATCYQAGVCADEVFDITPSAGYVTESLLADPRSFQLPRKYKIAFSGCPRDCADATIQDLGFLSKRVDGVDGFAVYLGGGLGAASRVGRLLEEFIPVAQAARVSEAVKRVFDQHGNRKNRNRARIRFLVEDLGFDVFRKLYREELAKLGAAAPALRPAPFVEALPPVPAPHSLVEGFASWRHLNVAGQRQPGFFSVEIAPPLGILQADQLRRLAGVVERYGEGVLRATNWQNVLLRWVSEAVLPALHAELVPLGLGAGEPPLLRRMVTCIGADTCRIGVCVSHTLALAIRETLVASNLDFAGGTGQLHLHISGCPNTCGRHLVADIGLSGSARRVDGQVVPHYTVHLGGHVEEGSTELASRALILPAAQVPAWLVDFLRRFEASAQYPDFAAFLAAGGRNAIP